MPRFDVPFKISPSDQNFSAKFALVRRISLGVKANVLVQITWIAERSQAVFALQRFVSGVRSKIIINFPNYSTMLS